MSDASSAVGGSAVDGCDEFMLFGVRLTFDPMRKSVSMNNLSDYEPAANPNEKKGDEVMKVEPVAAGGIAAGCPSADDAVPQLAASRSRERKRGLSYMILDVVFENIDNEFFFVFPIVDVSVVYMEIQFWFYLQM